MFQERVERPQELDPGRSLLTLEGVEPAREARECGEIGAAVLEHRG